MQNTHLKTTVILLMLCLLMVFALNLKGEENDDLRNTAEKFVRQICEKDADAILQTYPMTDEFKAGMPNAAAITELAAEANRRFGWLGDVVQSEIVEHPDQGLRSVFLYYQGTKRPAKIWVTFSGTDITGLHWNVWTEGYADRKGTLANISVMMSITWGIVLIPMVIISLFLLNGKGAFLIAGYNTMSKEEQAKYDEKALCRSTGRFLLWITCCMMLVPFGIHGGNTWMLYSAVGTITVSTFIYLIYANTGNRFHKKGDIEEFVAEGSEEAKNKEAKREKIQLWLMGFYCFGLLAVMLAVPVLLITDEIEPTVEITGSGVRINGKYGVEINFTEITDISLMENRISDIELTWRTFGYATSTTQKGYFRSNMYGSVLLFTKTNSSPTIHIERDGKADVFLNFSNEEETRILYNDLKTAFAR